MAPSPRCAFLLLLLLSLNALLPAPAAAQAPRGVTERAAALVSRWLEAQNRGDFAAYQALYADGFVGIRRSGAQVRQMDREAWLKDRGRMFQRPMIVQAADLTVYHKDGVILVRFVQTFSSGQYHDRGPKLLRLSPAPDAGPDGLRIVREEMISSEKLPAPPPPAAAGPRPRYDCVAADPGQDPGARAEFIAECEQQCAQDPRACAAVGRLFEEPPGRSAPPDLQRALRAYERGCKRGERPSTCELAARLLLQRGDPADAERGLSLLGCAEQGCQDDLYYELLIATKKQANVRRALAHYEERCDAGNSDPTLLDGTQACYAAADIHEEGSAGKARPDKAERLRRRAARLRRENEKVWEKCPEC